MKQIFLLIVFLLSFSVMALAQGTVRGKITDANGESLIGATVMLQSDKAVGTVTDFDGNYSIKIASPSAQILVISYIGYGTIQDTVNPMNNEVLVRNLVLSSVETELAEVEIVARKEKDRTYYMENIKKKSATSIDYVSSQSMKLTGDNNAASAVARVTGVSTNGSFITVRGIGDRYVKTGINGAQIPTLDPFTNNIKLDIIPASLIDNIIITKTASPELPGSWTGAYISVETKDFPEKFSLNVETQVGYNEQTSFKNVLANATSSTDWLGYDNDFRDRDHAKFVNFIPNPSQYQELVALGLGDYYKSLGVNQSWLLGTSAGENYYKLGLIELGLLPKALFNDPQAYEQAKSLYVTNGYKDKAYTIINTDAGKSGKSFPNNWNTFNKKAPLNFSQSFSIGNRIQIFNKDFGYYAGFRYGNSIQFDPNAVAKRAIFSDVDSLGNPQLGVVVDQRNVRYINGWSALLHLAYKHNSNNYFSFLFMPNLLGVNSIKDGLGIGDLIFKYTITKNQFYEQRRQLVYQFKSENYLPGPGIRLEWNATYTKGKSSAPDFKNLEFFANDDFVYYYDKTMSYMSRDYRYLSEDIFDSKFSMEYSLTTKPEVLRKLKLGAAYQNIQKFYDQFNYGVNFNGASPYVTDNDLDKYFSTDRFDLSITNSGGYPHNSVDFFYGRPDFPSNHTFGKSDIISGFLLLDYAVYSRLRFSGGLRVEYTDLYTDAIEYHNSGLAYNDLRRVGHGQSFIVNPGKLQACNYLPSAGLIFKLRSNEISPINLRLNYGKSIARPSLREYSETIVYDYELNAEVLGNSQLKIVEIDNYDLRLESYFKSGDNITLSFFYKNFKNHIELIQFQGYTWTNADHSRVAGIELEGRKVIAKGLDIRANISLVESETAIEIRRLTTTDFIRTWIPTDTVTHKMFGQAPYVINGILSYSLEKIGWINTLSYNVQGPRLVLTSFNNTPDIYEMPRHLLDFKTTKTIGNHFAISLTIRDLLNTPVKRSYKYTQGYLVDFDNYRYGTNYILGVSYKL